MWLLYRLPEIKTLTKNHWFQQFKQLVVMFAMSLLIINMGYLFERTGKLLGSYRFQTTLFTGYQTLADIPTSGGNRFEKTPLAYLPMPFPSNFIQGIDTQRLDFERGLPSYLRGKWSKHGWYALSVNHLYNREKQSRYFLNFEPVATAGYSIYIYHITMEDANRVRHEMGLPEIEGITSEQNQ
jgi:hypothetical protein